MRYLLVILILVFASAFACMFYVAMPSINAKYINFESMKNEIYASNDDDVVGQLKYSVDMLRDVSICLEDVFDDLRLSRLYNVASSFIILILLVLVYLWI